MNTKVFGTKALVKSKAKYPVSVDTYSATKGNLQLINRKMSTIGKHADYQLKFETGKKRTLLFGIFVFDTKISSEWDPEVQELDKLPKMLQVGSNGDMLSHIGYSIGGINNVQFYMKVPGNRTALHQEDLNMCSVNMNFGPGNVTWWFVERIYYDVIVELCKLHNMDVFDRIYWPDMNELRNKNIPVHVITQQPGDIVYTNVGTLHWVESNGVTNAVAWNVGPKTFNQYQAASDRYNFLKIEKKFSVIPLVRVIWNMARDGPFDNTPFFRSVLKDLQLSLDNLNATRRFVASMNIATVQRAFVPNERCVCREVLCY